ncbi:MAG: zinc finger-like domain-containing protein, partial [Candidatus Micrarchaeota archaeon]
GPFERVPGLPWLVGFTGETLERFMVSAFKPTILEEATAAYETSMTVLHYQNLLHSAYWRGDYSPQLESTRRLWQGKRKHGFEYTWGGEMSEFEFDEEKKVFRDVDDHEEIACASCERRGTDVIIAHLPNGKIKIFKKTLGGRWNELGMMNLEDDLRKTEAAVDWTEGRLGRYKKERVPLGKRLEELQLDGKAFGSDALANASIDDLRGIVAQKKEDIKFFRSMINRLDAERGQVQKEVFAEEGWWRSNVLGGGYHRAIESLVAQEGHPDVGHNVGGKKSGIFGALAGYTVRVPAAYGGLAGMGGYFAQGYHLIGYPVSPPSEILRANFAMGGLTGRLLYPTWLIGHYAARMTRPVLTYWFDLRTPEGKSPKEQVRYFDDYGAPLVETEETMRIRREIAELRQRRDEEARAEEAARWAKLRKIIEEGSMHDDVWHNRKGRARIILKENVFIRTEENGRESFFETGEGGGERKITLKNATSPGAIAKFSAQTVRNWVFLGYDYSPIFRGGGAGSAIANLVTKPFLKLGVDIPTSMLAPMWAPFDARQYDLHVPVISGIPASVPFFGMFGSGFRQRESRIQLEKGGDVSPRDTDFVGLKQGAHRVGLSKVSGKVDWENDMGKTVMEKEILKRRAGEIGEELERAGDEAARRRLESERNKVNELIEQEMDKRMDQLDTQVLAVGPDRSEALRFAPLFGPSGIFKTYYGGFRWDPQYWPLPWRAKPFAFGRPSRVTQGRFGQIGVGGEAIVDWIMTPPSGMPIGYVSGRKLMGGMDWGDAGGFDRGYRSTDTRSDRDANLEPYAAHWYINKYRGDVTSPEYERMLVNVGKILVKREKSVGEAAAERGEWLKSQIDFEMQNPSLGFWSPWLYLYGGIRRRYRQAKSEGDSFGERLLKAAPVVGQHYASRKAARAAGLSACPECNGQGKISYGIPCPKCRGKKFL